MTFGKNKYGFENWKKVEPKTRWLSAALRHIFAYMRGEIDDKETGLPHLSHAITSLIYLMEN
jgi:hypothetical protein